MEFYVVADEDTVAGFRYAGVRGLVVATADAAREELQRLADEDAELIVITTERIADSVRDTVNAIRYEGELPLIVEIPGPRGPSERVTSLEQMIRDAVGIRF
jgi:V/A-type H+-transporting ATPase subunit F